MCANEHVGFSFLDHPYASNVRRNYTAPFTVSQVHHGVSCSNRRLVSVVKHSWVYTDIASLCLSFAFQSSSDFAIMELQTT